MMKPAEKIMRRNKIRILSFVLFFSLNFLSLSARTVQAADASLFLTPGSGTFIIDSAFSVNVIASSGGEEINAAEGKISFDASLLEATGISKTGSIFPFWTTEPSINNTAGTVIFGGGRPRPAFIGESGQICTISFKAKKAGTASLRFTSGAVLANDGKGSNILASMGSASFVISPKVEAPAVPSAADKTETDIKASSLNESKSESDSGMARPFGESDKPTISSLTDPDQNVWYNSGTAVFKWDIPDSVTSLSYVLDENPVTEAPSKDTALAKEKKYENLPTGIHYFHLRYKVGSQWGPTGHYRVMIDMVPPEPFGAEVRKVEVGEWPDLMFETTDKNSGLDKYEIFVGSLEEREHEVGKDEKSLKLSDLEVGEHTAMIKAVDLAGNERITTIHFTIEPIETPAILNYQKELKTSDRFFMNGTSLPDVDVLVYISNEKNELSEQVVKSDAGGSWVFIADKGLPNDRYTAWAVARNKNGIKSFPSQKVSFLNSPPVFAVIGNFVINYFTVFVSLLFMIVLIILIIAYTAGFIRKRLRKETFEVEEVLNKNTKAMKSLIEKEFAGLTAFEGRVGYKKEKEKMRLRLLAQLDESARRSLKEVRDVEDILK